MGARGSAVRFTTGIRSFFQAAGRIVTAFLVITAVAALPTPASADSSLGVARDYNRVDGWGFPAGTVLTLSVNGGVKGTMQVTADSNDSFWASWWDADVPNQQLQPGDTITASDGGTLDVQMEVQDLRARVDRAAGRVLGTAKSPGGTPLSGRAVSIEVYASDWAYPPLTTASGTTDSSGLFNVNPGIGLTLEHHVLVTLWSAGDGSATGHRTVRLAYNSVPSLAAMASQNWISGNYFPPEMEITLTVNGGAKGSLPTTTDLGGNFSVSWWDAGDANRLVVGDTITAAFAGFSVEMQIQDVSAAVDLATHSVTGRGLTPGGSPLAGRKVRVGIYDPQGWPELASAEATLNAGGYFTVNTWSPAHEPARGEVIQVELWHASNGAKTGHRTYFHVYNEIPALGVNIDWNQINLQGFPPDASVTVSVNAGAKGTQTVVTGADGWQWVNWSNGNWLAAGDTVTAVCGDDTVEMVVPDIQATADVDTDSIAGTAFDGAQALDGRKVYMAVYPPEGGTELTTAETTVENGNFSFDLTPFDLVPGQQVWLAIWDAADGTASGNQVYRQVYNGIPVLTAYVDRQRIRGSNFPTNTELTIDVNAGAKGSDTMTTDPWGNFNSGDDEEYAQGLSAGDTITVSFGTKVVEMVIQDVGARGRYRGRHRLGDGARRGQPRVSGRRHGKREHQPGSAGTARLAGGGPRRNGARCVQLRCRQRQPLGHPAGRRHHVGLYLPRRSPDRAATFSHRHHGYGEERHRRRGGHARREMSAPTIPPDG